MKKNIFTVWELNNYIKGIIESDFNLSNITVAGEISNFTHHRSGHMYFTLKDEKSSLRCVFFKGSNFSCKFLPSNGMKVWGKGRVSVYEPSGQYQLYVKELEPAGMGALYLAFEQLKEKLEKEGLFLPRHKKPLPSYPRRVGLVTSPTGAALQDILSTAKNRFAPVAFLVVETLVQGTSAPGDIVEAIKYLNRRGDVDVIVLARGGGSLEDLWAFNGEEVARTIFASAIPVISAIGHETDFTISDFVADYRAPTPTAASTRLFPCPDDLRRHIANTAGRLAAALKRRAERDRQRLEYLISDRFFQWPLQNIRLKKEHCLNLQKELEKSMISNLQDYAYRFKTADNKLEGLSPLRIMQRGYTFCRDEEGRLITSVSRLSIGQVLELSLADGKASTRVVKFYSRQGRYIE